jgi:hypothetical protein
MGVRSRGSIQDNGDVGLPVSLSGSTEEEEEDVEEEEEMTTVCFWSWSGQWSVRLVKLVSELDTTDQS